MCGRRTKIVTRRNEQEKYTAYVYLPTFHNGSCVFRNLSRAVDSTKPQEIHVRYGWNMKGFYTFTSFIAEIVCLHPGGETSQASLEKEDDVW